MGSNLRGRAQDIELPHRKSERRRRTFLIAGALTAAEYFNRDAEGEHEIRTLADPIYRRVDWQWARDRKDTVSMVGDLKADSSSIVGRATTKP